MSIPVPDPELPEGSMVLNALLVVSYLDSDGHNSYAVVTEGDAPVSTYLGLTVLAANEMMNWVREP